MNPLAIFYVSFIGVLFPVECVRSYYKLKTGAPFPSKTVYRLSTLFMHVMTLLLAILTWRMTWRSFHLPIFARATIGWKEIGYGFATLILFVAVMVPMWKKYAMTKPGGVYRTMPQTSSDLGFWTVIALSAGFVEEIVYRGVLFGILNYWLHNWWASAILCAVSFALGHAIQGWKSTGIIFAIAMIFQGLVYLTGTLYVAMVVHAVFDFIAGSAYLYFWHHGAKERMPAAPASPATV
jgi:membrane protease YdiL (CAAX protease family)